MYIEKDLEHISEEKIYGISDIIVKNTDKIEKKFNSIKSKGRFITWSWPTFFFSFLWFAYRKMYIESILIFLVTQAIKVLPIALEIKGILNFAFWIGLTLTANGIYMKKVDSIVEEVNDMDDLEAEIFIKKNAGTSFLAVILMIILAVILTAVGQYFNLFPTIKL